MVSKYGYDVELIGLRFFMIYCKIVFFKLNALGLMLF